MKEMNGNGRYGPRRRRGWTVSCLDFWEMLSPLHHNHLRVLHHELIVINSEDYCDNLVDERFSKHSSLIVYNPYEKNFILDGLMRTSNEITVRAGASV